MQTIGEHGVLGLFRGMAAPFATVAFYNAVIFAARGQMEKALSHADGELKVLLPSNVAKPWTRAAQQHSACNDLCTAHARLLA